MKIICADYTGWRAIVTGLGVPDEVFYRGDASSTVTDYILAYYATNQDVAVFQSSGTVAIATVVGHYASAVAVAGLLNVEV